MKLVFFCTFILFSWPVIAMMDPDPDADVEVEAGYETCRSEDEDENDGDALGVHYPERQPMSCGDKLFLAYNTACLAAICIGFPLAAYLDQQSKMGGMAPE